MRPGCSGWWWMLVTLTVTMRLMNGVMCGDSWWNCEYCHCYNDTDGYRAANCSTSAFSSHYRKAAEPQLQVLNLHRPHPSAVSRHFPLFPRMFRSFKNIELLDISNCSVTYLPNDVFMGLQYVVEIDLSYNKIQHLNGAVFTTLRNLKTLVLRGNHLQLFSSWHALVSSSLVELDMGYCNIHSIPRDTFAKTPSLKRLYLDGNRLTSFGFVFPKHLIYLNLAKNDIVDVPVEVLGSFTYLKRLDLTDNPINCTCQLLLFQDQFSGRGNYIENFTCTYPSRYEGQSIDEINEGELCNYESSINHINSPLYPLDVARRSGKLSYEKGIGPDIMGDQPVSEDGTSSDAGTWLPDPDEEEETATEAGDSDISYEHEDEHDHKDVSVDTDNEEETSPDETATETSHLSHATPTILEQEHHSQSEEPKTETENSPSDAKESTASSSSPIPILDSDDTLPVAAELTSDNHDENPLTDPSPSPPSADTDLADSSAETTHPTDYYGTDEGSGDAETSLETDGTRSQETEDREIAAYSTSTTEKSDILTATVDTVTSDDSNATDTETGVSGEDHSSLSIEPTTEKEETPPTSEEEVSPTFTSSTTEETEIASNGTDGTDFDFSEESSPEQSSTTVEPETSDTSDDTSVDSATPSLSTTEESPPGEETTTSDEEETESTTVSAMLDMYSSTTATPSEEPTTEETEESTTYTPEVSASLETEEQTSPETSETTPTVDEVSASSSPSTEGTEEETETTELSLPDFPETTPGPTQEETTQEPSTESLTVIPELPPETSPEDTTTLEPELTTERKVIVLDKEPDEPEGTTAVPEDETGFTNEEYKGKKGEEGGDKKQSTGSYIVVALIALLVLGLIVLAVCKKRKRSPTKIRLPNDAESNLGTEMRDMDSLLPKPPENGVKILPKDYGEPNGEVKEEAQPVLLQEENLNEVDKPEQNGGVQRATARLTVLPEPVVQTPVFIHKPYPDD